MAFYFLPRSRRLLRKPRLKALTPKNIKACDQEIVTPDSNESASIDKIGVVRGTYSIRSWHADLIYEILVAARRSTGDSCGASDVVRLALDDLASKPIEEVIARLEQRDIQKRGRRSNVPPKPR